VFVLSAVIIFST